MSKETLTSTFTELRKGFFRLAMRFLSNQEDADDALQEAFFRLWKHADRIDTPEEAEALTIVTVKNLCIDTLRKRNHLQTVELDESRDNVLTESASDVMQHDAADHPQTGTCGHTLIGQTRTVLYSAYPDSAAFSRITGCRNVPGRIRPLLVPAGHSIDRTRTERNEKIIFPA